LKNKLEMAMAEVQQQEEKKGEKNVRKGEKDNNMGVLYERQKKELIELKLQLKEKQRELDNSQSQIEQLNYDQAQEIEMRTLHLSNEIKSYAEKLTESEKKLANYMDVSAQNAELKIDLESLREMLDIKTRELAMLQKEYQPLKSTLDHTLKKLNYELKNNQDVIEKQIVTKLIITYFTSPKKQEVLEVMAGILNFSDENKSKIGLQTSPVNSPKKGWLGGWFSSTNPPSESGSAGVSASDVLEGKNFADLWIAFLLHEAENERNNNSAHEKEKNKITDGADVGSPGNDSSNT